MKHTCKTRNLFSLSLGIGLLTMMLVPGAAQTDEHDGDHSVVVAPHSVVDGKTLQEWAALWEKWTFAFPVNDNPARDATGEKSKFGDLGRVFLLAGWFGSPPSGTIYRSVTIPVNKFIFFSLESATDENVGNCTTQPTTPCKGRLTIDELHAQLADAFKVSSLHASIDGKQIGHLWQHREKAPVFSYTLQLTDNLYQAVNKYPYPDAVGTVFPVVGDGYFLMLKPLSVGHHTINFGGTTVFAGNQQEVDVIYDVTVTPTVSLKPAVLVP
jgi:hypothetical protein